MGPFAAYSIKVAILLVAGYLIYKWLMASEKQIAFNRRAIMTIYAASFAMTPVGALWAVIASPGAGATSGVAATALIAGSLAPAQAPLWPAVLVGLYAGGMAVTAIWTVVTLLRLRSIIRSGRHTACRGYTLVILPGREVAPFSWGRYVVMGIDDYRSAGRMITAHELAHIRHRHCLDLMVAQAVCIVQWFNPAAWLLREELKSVHEYQADDSVISYGADARQYQLLLIKKLSASDSTQMPPA